MTHSQERIAQRLSPAEAATLSIAIDRLAATMPDHRGYAVHVMSVPESRGAWTFEDGGKGISNGTELYAIIRGKRVHTVMWRRKAQPVNAAQFRVDVVGRVRL